MARMAIIACSPEKLRLSNGITPVKISQMLSKSMPRFLVSFIAYLLQNLVLDSEYFNVTFPTDSTLSVSGEVYRVRLDAVVGS